MKKPMYMIVSVLLICVSAFWFILTRPLNDPQTLLEEHFALLQLGQIKEAYEQTMSEDFRRDNSYSDFGRNLDRYFMLKDVNKVEIVSQDKTADHASLLVRLDTGGDLSLDLQVELEQQKREWQISRLTVADLNFPEGQDPRETLDEYASLLLAGKLPESYELFSSEAKGYTPLETYIQMFAYFPYVTDMRFEHRVLKQYDLFVGTGAFGYNEQSFELEIKLVNKDNGWLVNSVQTELVQ